MRAPRAGVLVVLVVLGRDRSRPRYLALESVYFIGTNARGLVTLYRGVPYQLPGGIDLYSSEYVSGVSASTLSPAAPADAARPLAALGRRRGRPAAPRTGQLECSSVNRPIVRLYGLVVVLFALLIAFTSRWTVFEAVLAAPEPAEPARAAGAGTHRTRADPRRRRDGARPQRPWPRRRRFNGPTRPARCSPRRSATPTPISVRRASSATATPRWTAKRPLQTCRRSSTSCRASARRATKCSPRSTRRAQRTAVAALGRTRRGRRGARPAHRRGQGDGLDARAMTRTALRSASAYERLDHESELAAAQPRHAVRLCAGLDVQDRHRHGRDRHRTVHAIVDAERAQRHPRLGGAAGERLQRKLRPAHAHRGTGQIGQHRLGAGGRTRRQADAGPLHEPLRLRRQAPARLSRRRDVGQRRRTRANDCSRPSAR